MYQGIAGKVALVTGGSRGIGKAIAIGLASEGARLAICARDEAELKITVDEIRVQTHTDIIGVKANVMKLNDIRRVVNAAVKKYSHVDILINNAAGLHIGGLLTTSDETLEDHIQTKLLGYIRTAREIIPYMKSVGGGKIINITGVEAKEPAPLFMLPGIINAAITNFTKSLSKELANDKIAVNCVSPATADTSLSAAAFQALAAISGKSMEEARAMAIRSVNGSLIDPQDIANIVLFLVSDLAKAITGTSITVDAGALNGIW